MKAIAFRIFILLSAIIFFEIGCISCKSKKIIDINKIYYPALPGQADYHFKDQRDQTVDIPYSDMELTKIIIKSLSITDSSFKDIEKPYFGNAQDLTDIMEFGETYFLISDNIPIISHQLIITETTYIPRFKIIDRDMYSGWFINHSGLELKFPARSISIDIDKDILTIYIESNEWSMSQNKFYKSNLLRRIKIQYKYNCMTNQWLPTMDPIIVQ